jgi:Uncharacterized protein conserved in bacteria (DUF2147)
MKRMCFFVALMALSSSAHAGNSYSFVIGGHRIRIEASSYCRSASCVSVSIPGVYRSHGGHRYDEAAATPTAPAKPLASLTEQAQPPVSPVNKSSTEHGAAVPPAIVAAPAAPQDVAPLSQNVEPSKTPVPPPIVIPPPLAPAEPPAAAVQPAPEVAPPVLKISQGDEPEVTPLGDWRIEGKKQSVRIEQCGAALCGYILNPSSNQSGETVLINMKPSAAKWSGNIYSRDSGATYYATIALKQPNSLRVEVCALGKFFCSDTVWSRIDSKPEKLISSGTPSPGLRS